MNNRKTELATKPLFVALSFRRFMRFVEVDTINKLQNQQVTTTNQILIWCGNFVVLSFRRALEKTTKRIKGKMKFQFVVLATCKTRQNDEIEFHFVGNHGTQLGPIF